MSAVSISTIRQRFATAVQSLDGFHELRNPFDGYGRSPNTVANLGFAVGVRNVSTRDDSRQRQSVGVMCETELFVRFIFRIRPKDQLTSLDEGFDNVETVVRTLTNRSTPLHDDLQIRFMGFDNELSDSGEYAIFTLSFNIIHYLSLGG